MIPKKPKSSIAEQIFKWVKKHPYIIWGLKNDFINFSSVTRAIQKELDIKNFDAILIALRRFQSQIQKIPNDENIIKIVKESSMEIRTRTNVYVIKKEDFNFKILENLKHFHFIHGKEAIVLITNNKLNLKTIYSYENTLEFDITSPVSREKIPGVAAYIYLIMAENGINILETYSAYTGLILILEKKDLSRAVEALESIGLK